MERFPLGVEITVQRVAKQSCGNLPRATTGAQSYRQVCLAACGIKDEGRSYHVNGQIEEPLLWAVWRERDHELFLRPAYGDHGDGETEQESPVKKAG